MDLNGIEQLLLSLHMMAAAAMKTPEIALSEDESKMLAKAVKNVADHYPMVVDPKYAAWGSLAMACGAIYGPRIFLMVARKPAKNKAPTYTGNVVEMPGAGSLPPFELGQ